jgi:N-acetylgalactosamine kinase
MSLCSYALWQVRAEDVALPEGAVFVVANSLAVSKKAEGAHRRYNLRVVECRLAAAVLAAAMGVPPATAAAIKTLQAGGATVWRCVD